MLTISVWSDFACPYCYIGETRLQNAIRDLGVEDRVSLDYRAYELDQHASATPPAETTVARYARKYHLPEGLAIKKVEEISQMGRDMGLDFNYANVRFSNTRDAHRLMKLAEDKYDRTTVDRLNSALFDAYFGYNKVLADHEVLLSVAESVGMRRDQVKAMLDSNEYAEAVHDDERYAAEHGMKGVPCFVFNNKHVIPGAVSTEDFKQVLEQLLFHEKTHAPLHDEHPHACNHDNCQLP